MFNDLISVLAFLITGPYFLHGGWETNYKNYPQSHIWYLLIYYNSYVWWLKGKYSWLSISQTLNNKSSDTGYVELFSSVPSE